MKINHNYNFNLEVKKEIFLNYMKKIENHINCDFLFLGYLLNCAEYDLIDDSIEFYTQNADVIKLFKLQFTNKVEIYKSDKKSLKYNSTKYKLIIRLSENNNLKEFFLNKKLNIIFLNKQEKNDFLTGVFLSAGSINNPSKSYHLEIRIVNNKIIETIENTLNYYDISFNHILYRKKYVIYVKKSESISDFLKILEANENMYILEDYRIEKDLTNSLQRLNNLEFSNIKKQINANQRIIHVIKKIIKTKEFNNLNNNIKIYCNQRIKYPDISMSDMVKLLNEEYNINITKSWINHINNKLIKIYEEYKDEL